eukprot:TRINITY_DN3719_c0_g1_i1.p1 TRINITY_DN3719_c0_g1~~TRINITY_DN3719_c0_g1_i1.p1  ORF type:complete len:433 (-),score=56.27 TRINITY_DN3719_c0_g1_i1:31-1251(-)
MSDDQPESPAIMTQPPIPLDASFDAFLLANIEHLTADVEPELPDRLSRIAYHRQRLIELGLQIDESDITSAAASPPVAPGPPVSPPASPATPSAEASIPPPPPPPMPPRQDNTARALRATLAPIRRRWNPRRGLDHDPDVPQECGICFERPSDTVSLRCATLHCQHKYCTSCLELYIGGKIKDGQVAAIICPTPQCRKQIDDDLIKLLVDAATYTKYQNFKLMLSHPDYRRCPKCDHVQRGSKKRAQMQCSECQTEYCFWHGGAHQNSTCAAYEEKTKELESGFHSYKQTNTKPCPKCKAPIERLSTQDCNHMVCHCGYNFCWLCLGSYRPEHCNSLFRGHYSILNPFGCPGLQFEAAPSPARIWGRRCAIVLASPLILAASPYFLAKDLLQRYRYWRMQRQYRGR